MLTGLGVRPQQLVPDALEALTKAERSGGTNLNIDQASIDAGLLARTVLVAKLLGDPPGPLAVLPRAAIAKFKLNFNSGKELSASAALQAAEILRQSSRSSTLEGPSREVAARWIAGLCPLGPILGHPRP
jgi:hypothetical protein